MPDQRMMTQRNLAKKAGALKDLESPRNPRTRNENPTGGLTSPTDHGVASACKGGDATDLTSALTGHRMGSP